MLDGKRVSSVHMPEAPRTMDKIVVRDRVFRAKFEPRTWIMGEHDDPWIVEVDVERIDGGV